MYYLILQLFLIFTITATKEMIETVVKADTITVTWAAKKKVVLDIDISTGGSPLLPVSQILAVKELG